MDTRKNKHYSTNIGRGRKTLQHPSPRVTLFIFHQPVSNPNPKEFTNEQRRNNNNNGAPTESRTPLPRMKTLCPRPIDDESTEKETPRLRGDFRVEPAGVEPNISILWPRKPCHCVLHSVIRWNPTDQFEGYLTKKRRGLSTPKKCPK